MFKFKTLLPILAIALISFSMFSCKENSVVAQSPHQEAAGLVIYKDSTIALRIFNTLVDSTISTELLLDNGKTTSLTVRFLGEDGKILSSVEDEVNFVMSIDDSSLVDFVHLEIGGQNEKNEFFIRGTSKKTGSTGLTIRLDHEGHTDFTTPKFTIQVK